MLGVQLVNMPGKKSSRVLQEEEGMKFLSSITRPRVLTLFARPREDRQWHEVHDIPGRSSDQSEELLHVSSQMSSDKLGVVERAEQSADSTQTT